jgi:DNA-binding NtrC family response regulator
MFKMPLRKLSGTILSISYDRELLTLRQAFLETEGYSVRSVITIDDALALLCGQHFDVVLIGHTVPPEATKSMILSAKKLRAHLPVLTIVADPNEKEPLADASVAGSAGPDALIEALQSLIPQTPGERPNSAL